MGWETNVPTMLTFNKVTYNTPYEVDCKIDETEDLVKRLTNELLVMITARPQDTFNEDITDLFSLKRYAEEQLEYLKECWIELSNLRELKENFKCVGGDFVENPNYEKNIQEWFNESGINENIEYYNEKRQEQTEMEAQLQQASN